MLNLTHPTPYCPKNSNLKFKLIFSDNPGLTKCIFRRGQKYVEKVQNTSKQCISIMFCGSADGFLLRPMVVYKAKNLYLTWCQGGPEGTEYSCTPSGWFDSFEFRKCFFNVFMPHAKTLPSKKVLLGDNLSSHLTMDVIDACRKNNIAFCCLPPNSTHILQPLDVAPFAPLKAAWRTVLKTYKVKYPSKAGIDKAHFPTLLRKTLERSQIGNHLPAGFAKCGLFPVSLAKATERLPSLDNEVLDDSFKEILDGVVGERLEGLRGVDKASQGKQ